MTVPAVSGLARQYLASFEGDDFVPQGLGNSGLLSEAGKALMGSIAAANLATETAAMKGGFDLQKQESYNDTLLAIQELKNEQAKKKAIIDQLSTPMAGDSLISFLSGGPGNRLKGSMDNLTVDNVLKNSLIMPSSGNDSSDSTTVESTDLSEALKQRVEEIEQSSDNKNQQYKDLLKLLKENQS